MSSSQIARCLLIACFTVAPCWAQRVVRGTRAPASHRDAEKSRGSPAAASGCGQHVRPVVGGPDGAGSLPGGKFVPGPDGVGGVPVSASLPRAPLGTLQDVGAPADGAGAGGEGQCTQVSATSNSGGGGVIPKVFGASPRQATLEGGDAVGSLPRLSPDSHGSPVHVGGNGTGGIRSTITPTILPGSPPSPTSKPTGGVVIDASTHLPIAGILLVVLDSHANIAGLAITDESGVFVTCLAHAPGLELAIPSASIAGVPIEAGEILTILVP